MRGASGVGETRGARGFALIPSGAAGEAVWRVRARALSRCSNERGNDPEALPDRLGLLG